MSNLIEFVRQGPLAIITLNRPERHKAFNDEMSDAFLPILTAALEDDSSAILLRANGKSFCSGRDTSALGHGDTNRINGQPDTVAVRTQWSKVGKSASLPKTARSTGPAAIPSH